MFLYNGVMVKDLVLINSVNYSLKWIEQVYVDAPSKIASLGISYAADITPPDPNLNKDIIQNDDGSYSFTPYTQAELDAIEATKIADNISILWQAAHDFEQLNISGSAFGLLTIGVIQALPKSQAVQAWLGSLWDLYYTRKAQVGAVYDTSFSDFSSLGSMPYTIPELRAELGM